MDTTPQKPNPNSMNIDSPNWIADEVLARDKDQTHRLHEPDHIISSIDPISGVDIRGALKTSPVVPILPMATRRSILRMRQIGRHFQEMPTDHPVHLPDNPNEEGEAEG